MELVELSCADLRQRGTPERCTVGTTYTRSQHHAPGRQAGMHMQTAPLSQQAAGHLLSKSAAIWVASSPCQPSPCCSRKAALAPATSQPCSAKML